MARLVDPKSSPDANAKARAQFREPIVIRPQIAPGRSRIGGGKAWPIAVALLILLLGMPVLLLISRAAGR